MRLAPDERVREALRTAKLKLVTLIATSELEDRIVADLRLLGATGYTSSTAGGGGAHGPRRRGFLEMGNVRIETLVSAEVGQRILEHVVHVYEGLEVVAFSHEVEAVPPEHFVPK
jgi:hypothetical protein